MLKRKKEHRTGESASRDAVKIMKADIAAFFILLQRSCLLFL
jgi:hypothetical protein